MEVFENNTRMRIVYEDNAPLIHKRSTQDSNRAELLYVEDEDEENLFVVIQSWDENYNHDLFNKIERRILDGATRIRVTIEVS